MARLWVLTVFIAFAAVVARHRFRDQSEVDTDIQTEGDALQQDFQEYKARRTDDASSEGSTDAQAGRTDDQGSVRSDDGAVSLRPNAASDEADIVHFGLYAKTFYGVSMNGQTFTMDNVVTLKWLDPRTESLIPDGTDSITLSAKDAAKALWMPEVVITNREIRKFELISTSVTVSAGGNVTKVERSLCMMKNKYDVKAFPFDQQVLSTKIASSKYMLNEVKLKPIKDTGISNTNEGLFDGMGWFLKSFDLTEFEDIDGSLQKSRGVSKITVERDIAKYLQNHFIPSLLFMFISFGVFWFPYQNAFITPRLALGILSLLSFTTLCLKVDTMLPPGGPFCWNDVYNLNCQWLLFITVILNIFTEIVFHQCECQPLGKSLNHEAKLVWPFLMLVGMAVAFFDTSGNHLQAQSVISTTIIVSIFVCFMSWSILRVNSHMAKNKKEGDV